MRKLLNLFTVFSTVLLFSCKPDTAEKEAPYLAEAKEIAQSIIITDGHVDLPYRMKVARFRLQKEFLDVSGRTEGGNFDYVRSKEGGLDAPFMSIYIPASYQENEGASKAFADSLIDMVERITREHPDKFAIATSPQQVEEQYEKGLISLPMGMENGAPIEKDLANVQHFYDRGVRYITLTHSKVNNICDSSYDTTRTWNGLSPFGREVVAEMNKVGIMVDISHVSDSTFYQVMEIAKAPCIASHSSARYYTPRFERNMSDEMIKLLAENDGVIQINFGSTFIDSVSREKSDLRRAKIRTYLEENDLSMGDSLAREYMEELAKTDPLFSDVKVVADHIDHVIKLAGVDHVAFGSDFDGVGDTLPNGLKDVSEYPNLIAELLARGYSQEDIEKICYKNVFRVWNKVQEVADQLQAKA